MNRQLDLKTIALPILMALALAVTGCADRRDQQSAKGLEKSRSADKAASETAVLEMASALAEREADSGDQGELDISHEDLDAVLWMRSSAEFEVIVRDSYARALTAATAGLDDSRWSALPDQRAGWSEPSGTEKGLPPAVILDVDETVLDNSMYQVECLTEAPQQFDEQKWNAWCEKAEATAMPGARVFIERCRQQGIAIRFLTNRDSKVRDATLRNLQSLGLMPADETAHAELLCKNDQPDWGSDKTSRRAFVAREFRVLVMVGDDLNDFLWVGDKAPPRARMVAADDPGAMWGDRWFLLPNANYGGWEKAVQEYRFPLERTEALKLKMRALRESVEGGNSALPAGN